MRRMPVAATRLPVLRDSPGRILFACAAAQAHSVLMLRYVGAGDITNMETKTPNPQDPKLMRLVERKHRQEVKMSRAPRPPDLVPHILHCAICAGDGAEPPGEL